MHYLFRVSQGFTWAGINLFGEVENDFAAKKDEAFEANLAFIRAKELRYMVNALSRSRRRVRNSEFFLPCVNAFGEDGAIELLARATQSPQAVQADDNLPFENDTEDVLRAVWNKRFAVSSFRKRFFSALLEKSEELVKMESAALCGSLTRMHLVRLSALLELTPEESEILLIAFIGKTDWDFGDVANDACRSLGRYSGGWLKQAYVTSMLSGLPYYDCVRAMRSNGRLKSSGCIDDEAEISPALYEILGTSEGDDDAKLLSNFYSPLNTESLPMEMYGKKMDFHSKLIEKLFAGRKKDEQFNLLLYGEPGTGKTSYAASLAKSLGLTPYVVAQQSSVDDGRGRARSDYSPGYRFAALRICDKTLSGSAENIILVDEADKMLEEGKVSFLDFEFKGPHGGKGILNSVLDSLKTPCIWITNCKEEELSESSRRRFNYSIRFEKLSSERRIAIWHNALGRHKLQSLFPEDQIASLAERYPVNAGGIDLAVKSCKGLSLATTEAVETARKILESHCRLLGIRPIQAKQTEKSYALEGLNIKGAITPQRLIASAERFRHRSVDSGARRLSMLLNGPPGCGKTEFAKHLAEVLDCKLDVRLGADLLSMYVGGTEHNIREAFTEAEASDSILLLDEADGLLRSRQMAQRSWEVTQVNELLHCMENFNGILICATNNSETLDPATLRRFVFKLDFDYSTASGKQTLFERFFGHAASGRTKDALDAIRCLAPGDFRVVRDKLLQLEDDAPSDDELVEMLLIEVESKKQGAKDSIGFRTL